MRIIKTLINEQVSAAKGSLSESNADNVIEHCLEYLKRLDEYRKQLLGLKELPEIDLDAQTPFAQELVAQVRSAMRAAIEITVSETNRTRALLDSFTSISIYEAAATLNTFRYEGSNNWVAGNVGVRYSNGFASGFLPTVQALEVASQLRREAYELLQRGTSQALGQ